METAEKRKQSKPRELKKERLEFRITPSRKEFIQRAMAISGQSAGDLAYEGARQVVERHERMVLQGADKEVFLEALLDPPAPNKALVDAFKLHRKVLG